MKHPILVLVCALALSANLNAQKIPTLKPLKELPGTLMPVEKKGRWGYADQKGKTVIKAVFEVAEGFRPVTADGVTMDVAKIRIEGKWGFITKENVYLILPVYDEVTNFDEGGNAVGSAAGFKSLFGVNPALSEKKTFQTLSGTILKMNLNDITPFNEYGVAKACEESKWGLMNRKGAWILPAEYDSIDEDYGMFFIKRGGKTGIASLDGRIQVEPVYDGLTWDPEKSHFLALKDGKYGIVYSNGKTRYPCIFDQAPVESSRGYVEMWQGNTPSLFIPDDRLYSVEEYDDLLFRDGAASYASATILPAWMKKHLDKAAPVTLASDLKESDLLDVSAYDGNYTSLSEIVLKCGRPLSEVLLESLGRSVPPECLYIFDDGNQLYIGSHVYEDYHHISVIDLNGDKGWGDGACGFYTVRKKERIIADDGVWAGGFSSTLAPRCFNKAGRPHIPVLRYEYHVWGERPIIFLGHNVTPDSDGFEQLKDGWRKTVTGPVSFRIGDFLHSDSDDYREDTFIRIQPAGPDGIAVYEIQQQGIDHNEDYENPSRGARRTVGYGFIGLTRPFFTQPLFEDARNVEGGSAEVKVDGSWKQMSLKQLLNQDPFVQLEIADDAVVQQLPEEEPAAEPAAPASQEHAESNWLIGNWEGVSVDRVALSSGNNAESPVYLRVTKDYYQLSFNGPVNERVKKIYYCISKATKDGSVVYRLLDVEGSVEENEAVYYSEGEEVLHLPNGAINLDIDFKKAASSN